MIERNIFQTWKSKSLLPDNFKYWSETVKRLNPQFEYFLWDDVDNRAFIREHYSFFLDVYDNYPSEIYRADAVRYFWLYHFGGIYIDMDSECLRPLDNICQESTGIVLGRMGRDLTFIHSIPNAVMMSSSRETFWLYVIQLLMSSRDSRQHPEDLTGSIFLKTAVDSFCSKIGDSEIGFAVRTIQDMLPDELHPKTISSQVKILPSDCFFPVNWADPIHQRYFRKRIIADGDILPRSKVLDLFPNSYIVSYWAHSWEYPGK
jgi:inositol phosphorylceramide mannosyltransferase catalytic subunit